MVRKTLARRRPSTFGLQMAGLGVLAVAATVLSVAALTQNTPVTEQSAPLPVMSAIPEDVTFAAVGDSISEGDSPDFSDSRIGDLSWVKYAQGDSTHFVGGWAVGGTTTLTMAENTTPFDADVLVILAGTNDLSQGLGFDQTEANMKEIARKSGIDKVILSSIPPRNDDAEGPADFNQKLQTLALAEGWQFVDAVAPVRSGSRYAEGLTDDGIHPTATAAKAIGASLRTAILEANG